MSAAVIALFAGVLASCGTEKDVPAAGAAPEASTAPARLTDEQVAGTWEGTTYLVPGDSAVATWLSTQVVGGSGTLVVISPVPDTIAFSSTFDADSMMGTSEPYTDATLPAGTPPVFWKSVGRLTADGKLVGTTSLRLATSPDSIIQTMRWTAARRP
jgi:hypothetical protein